jgi:hypothetical protein
MNTFWIARLIFAVLAVVFFWLAVSNPRNRDTTGMSSRKTWVRIGLIFGAISIYLFLFQGHLP